MRRAADPIDWLPRRILVAGVSGVGKTTAAARISAATGIQHVEIDGLFHGPGWTRLPDFETQVDTFTTAESWLTEGQYSSVRQLLAERADTLIWLDLPTAITLLRVVRRTIRRAVTREELWNSNVEPGVLHALLARDGVIRWAWSTRKACRRRVPEVARQRPGLQVVRLRSRADVERWLRKLEQRGRAPAEASQ